jgi:hypothetical protein
MARAVTILHRPGRRRAATHNTVQPTAAMETVDQYASGDTAAITCTSFRDAVRAKRFQSTNVQTET